MTTDTPTTMRLDILSSLLPIAYCLFWSIYRLYSDIRQVRELTELETDYGDP